MKDTMPSPLRNRALHYMLLAFIYGVGMLTLLSHTVFHTIHGSDPSGKVAGAAITAAPCTHSQVTTHIVRFTDAGIVPRTTMASRCDKLTLVNDRKAIVIAALGPHAHHVQYPGFSEPLLSQGQRYSFQLSLPGTIALHDHDDDILQATLIIR